MNKTSSPDLSRLASSVSGPGSSAGSRPPARDCGHFDIRIARDGSWFYRGSPIRRMPLVKLFATVLQRDSDGQYWLVTPVERGRIDVDDVPFIAVEMMVESQNGQATLSFRTNIDEIVTLGPDHPLRIAEDSVTKTPLPYIGLRNGLEARLARPVFYELVDRGHEEQVGGQTLFGIWSQGTFFPLGNPEATD